MNDVAQFRESLSALLSLADASDGALTRDEIRGCFPEFELTDEQWELIYQYLEFNQIRIEDHEMDLSYAGRFVSEEDRQAKEAREVPESQYLSWYREEMTAAAALSEAEERELFSRCVAGDEDARNRIVEGRLSKAAELAGGYRGRGLSEADLIQEANLAMVMALMEYEGGYEGLDEYLAEQMQEAIRLALEETSGSDEIGSYLAGQANSLLQISTEMAQDLGREPSLSELSERLKLPEDTIRELMKMSLDAANVIEGSGAPE